MSNQCSDVSDFVANLAVYIPTAIFYICFIYLFIHQSLAHKMLTVVMFTNKYTAASNRVCTRRSLFSQVVAEDEAEMEMRMDNLVER